MSHLASLVSLNKINSVLYLYLEMDEVLIWLIYSFGLNILDLVDFIENNKIAK